jgi:hypothetical protein
MAQTNRVQSEKVLVYKTRIKLTNHNKIGGYITGISDTALLVTTGREISETSNKIVPAREIYSISFRKKGAIGRGIALGAATGGLLLFAVSQSTLEEGESLLAKSFGVTLFTILGISIGGGIGNFIGSRYPRKYIVAGDQTKFRLLQKELEKFRRK